MSRDHVLYPLIRSHAALNGHRALGSGVGKEDSGSLGDKSLPRPCLLLLETKYCNFAFIVLVPSSKCYKNAHFGAFRIR